MRSVPREKKYTPIGPAGWLDTFSDALASVAPRWHIREAACVPPALSAALRSPASAPDIRAVAAYLQAGGPSRVVEYRNPAACPAWGYGRKYADASGAARLTRKARLLAFGGNHFEIDLVGSFLSLVISHTSRQQFPALRSPAQVRRRLHGLISARLSASPPGTLVKEAVNRTIMKGAAAGLTALRRAGPTVAWLGTRAYQMLLDIQRATRAAVESLAARGYRPPPHATDVNRTYYVLESAEGAFMRVFVRALLRHKQPVQSLIWLHDGVWVSPRPTAARLHRARRVASASLGHHAAQLAVTEMHDEWSALMCAHGLHVAPRKAAKQKMLHGFEVEVKKTKRRRAGDVFPSAPLLL